MKAEADAAITRVIKLELQALPDQPWRCGHDSNDHQQAEQTGNVECQVVERDQAKGDYASLEDGHGITVVLKVAARNAGAVIKIASSSHFGPCGIDTKSDDGQ